MEVRRVALKPGQGTPVLDQSVGTLDLPSAVLDVHSSALQSAQSCSGTLQTTGTWPEMSDVFQQLFSPPGK